MQQADALKHIVELEADAEDLRFARLQQRLQQYPQAADWDVGSARLEIARALASNTRAVVEVGNTSDIARSLTMRDILQDESVRTIEPGGSNGNSNGAARPEA